MLTAHFCYVLRPAIFRIRSSPANLKCLKLKCIKPIGPFTFTQSDRLDFDRLLLLTIWLFFSEMCWSSRLPNVSGIRNCPNLICHVIFEIIWNRSLSFRIIRNDQNWVKLSDWLERPLNKVNEIQIESIENSDFNIQYQTVYFFFSETRYDFGWFL